MARLLAPIFDARQLKSACLVHGGKNMDSRRERLYSSAHFFMKKFVIISVLLVAAAVGGWFGYKKFRPVPPAGVRTTAASPVTVTRRTINSVVEAIGEVNPANQVTVKSEVSGRVQSIAVVTGQFVKRGEPLLLLDDTDLLTEKSSVQTEIAGATVRLDKAQRDYERQRNLFGEKLVSQEDFDSAKTALDLAKNEIEKSQRRLQTVEDKLSKVRILAPFDGTVLNVIVSKGQVVSGATGVSQGTDLMTFADLDEMVIRAHVNQIDAAKLKQEQAATITVDSLPGVTLEGKVTLVAPQATVKNNIKGFAVDVLVTRTDVRLRSGMNANLKLPIARAENTLAVPISAVFSEENAQAIYVMTPTGPARRVVRTGISDYRYCEILDGATEGETVVLERPAAASSTPKS